MFEWYILNTLSGAEKKVKAIVDERINSKNLKEYIADIFIANVKVTKVKKGKKILEDKNLYPGYIFIKADLSQFNVFNELTNIGKIGSFLGSKNKPNKVPQSEMDAIIKKTQSGEISPSLTFENGQKVNIKEGPFESFSGIIENYDNEKERLKLSVSIFGRSTSIELDYNQVEKISD